ncbi:aldehyde dehydrogenase family protein [Saccharopolyspora rosea]|uniref:Aldehyde dehydrogenase family protein n=1 Tax=Saccharopolyspora rosea TaxID=524884 RepID=A0ABW3FNA0_9PSEU|nr:aldehyde dehydrogenase family protein [Saccharopolyspora rosea]
MPEQTTQDWTRRAARLRPRTEAVIAGKPVPAADRRTFDTVNPATGEVLAAVAACGPAEADAAVAAARAAFDGTGWAQDAQLRKRVLLAVADAIEEHAAELALLESLDMGKPVREALAVDVPGSAATFRWYAEAIDKCCGEVVPTGPGDHAWVDRLPVGVVAAVVPWNYPLEIASWKLAPALAAGNTAVLKPAEQSPLSALLLAELAAHAGMPDGVLNVLPGLGPEAGRALGEHRDVDCVAFTGSTEVGRRFLAYSAESNGKPVWLEMGGKSPNIVFADADLDAAADKACFGAFYNAGQVCSSNSRLLVHRSVQDELVQRIVRHAARYRPGNPLDPDCGIGAMVSAEHADRVLGYLAEGRRTAETACGGRGLTVDGRGSFIEPTVFTGADNGMRIAREEIFGPVLTVIGFDTEEEAVELAADSRYALAASVWTGDLARAHRVASRLRVGTVSVNTVDALSVLAPFGGFGDSGFGRDLSLHAIEKFTGLRTTWLKY